MDYNICKINIYTSSTFFGLIFIIFQYLHSFVGNTLTNKTIWILDDDEYQSECKRNMQYIFSNTYVIISFFYAAILWKGYAIAAFNQTLNSICWLFCCKEFSVVIFLRIKILKMPKFLEGQYSPFRKNNVSWQKNLWSIRFFGIFLNVIVGLDTICAFSTESSSAQC